MPDYTAKMLETAVRGGDVAGQSMRRIREIERLSRQVETSKKAARAAKEAALKAGKVSTGWGVFANRDSISELQNSGTAQAKAIGELADTQTKFFEQHERLAQSVTEFTKLALASKASAQSVYRQLEARLSGADAATLSELAKQELMAVMVQARQMIDLTEQHEQVVHRLTSDEAAISELFRVQRELDSRGTEGRERLDQVEATVSEHAEEDASIRAALADLARHVDTGVQAGHEALEGASLRLHTAIGDSDRGNREAIDALKDDVARLQRRSVLMAVATAVSSAIAVAGLAAALLV